MKKILSMVVSLCLLLSIVDTFKPLKTAEAATQIKLASNVSVTLYDAQLVKDASGKLASFTIRFDNNSSNAIPLIDYWAKITGKSNKSYVTRLMSDDKEKRYVIPNSTTYLTYYAYVGAQDTLTDLSIDIIEWDFNVRSYERIVGKLQPANQGVTPYKRAEETNVDKSLLNVMLGSYKMYSDKDYRYFNIEFVVRNKSNAAVDLSKFQYYLTDGKGTMIPLSFSSKDQGSISLNPQERKVMLLSSRLDQNFATNNANIVVMYKDEAASVQLPKITFDLPALSDTAAVKAKESSMLQIGDQRFTLSVNEHKVSQRNGSTYTDTSIVLENKSTSKMSIPNLEFFIKTTQGYLYPLVAEEEAATVLLPNIKKELKLTGELPSGVDLKTSQFIVFNNEDKTQSQNGYFLGNFEIVVGSSDQPTTNPTSHKTYQKQSIEQISLQRIPSGNNDMLIAEFKVTNKDSKANAKLAIAGQFEIDGVKLSKDLTKVVYMDNLVAIGTDESYRVIAYTKIPYVQRAKNVMFNMVDKSGEKESDIHRFKVSETTSARLLASNEKYVIDSLGGRGEVQLVKSSILTGKQNDLFLAQLEYESKEQRSVVPTKLVGFIANGDGAIVELSIKPYSSRIMPNGKVILYGTAVIPKEYESKKINVYFGQTITAAEDEEISNVMLNPVYTQYITKDEAPAETFDSLPFMKYDISLYSFYAQFDSTTGLLADTIKLSFNYDMAVRQGAPEYSDAHRIVVEYVDPERSNIIFSKSFEIGGDKEDKFTVGTRNEQSITFTNPALQFANPGQYVINIYAEYEDYKKLIATKTFLFGNVQ